MVPTMHANLRQTLAGNGCQILFVCNGGIPADRTNSFKEWNLNLGLPRAPVRLITQNHNPDLAERIEKVGRSAAENQLALKKTTVGAWMVTYFKCFTEDFFWSRAEYLR